ncbi:hypothetical protein BJV78DRAFT_1160796 [Lactifluus subvellereus]|nr:hypothetical protein BJV78DRAFT_1160796 [Lactifluus subvellereus]
MPIPWAETSPLTSPLASIYVPGPDLPSLDPLLPDPAGVERIEATKSTPSCWTSDPGSSEDHSSALQFPVSMCPGLSTASTSLHSETPPLSLQDNDERNIEMFFEQISSAFSQSSSPSPPSNASSAPSTPNDSTLLSVPSPSQDIDVDKSTSFWDPSIPPSIFLAEQPVAFHDYEHGMFNLPYGES